jgi:hypothetical protein
MPDFSSLLTASAAASVSLESDSESGGQVTKSSDRLKSIDSSSNTYQYVISPMQFLQHKTSDDEAQFLEPR